jgi:hypothetical protein
MSPNYPKPSFLAVEQPEVMTSGLRPSHFTFQAASETVWCGCIPLSIDWLVVRRQPPIGR